MLVEFWERFDDKIIIFYLRKGVKFYNGDEMKVLDVKFLLERVLKLLEVFYILVGINGVEVLDDYIVKVIIEKFMVVILNNLLYIIIVILSEKVIIEVGDKFG